MSERSFHEDRAKQRTQAEIVAIEAQTSAEVVVCLRASSGSYRDADYLVGAFAALAALVTMLFVDRPFRLGSFPVGVVGAFVAGTLAASNIAQIRRLFVRRARALAAVRSAAKAAFFDLGVSRTRGRTGLLLYVSMFERRVEVVPDIGVDASALGPDWQTAVGALERSLAPRPDLDRFLAAMRALGPILGRALPRAADDVNELPDEVR